MSGLSADVWFPVVTLVVGTILAGFFQQRADRRATDRDKEARREQRTDAARLRRIEFQRSTLLELQERVAEYLRATGEAHHADEMAARQTGAWHSNLLPEGVNNRIFVAQTSMTKLRERVKDEQIRSMVKKLTQICVDVLLTDSATRGRELMTAAGELSGSLNECIGEQLRTLDDLEETM